MSGQVEDSGPPSAQLPAQTARSLVGIVAGLTLCLVVSAAAIGASAAIGFRIYSLVMEVLGG